MAETEDEGQQKTAGHLADHEEGETLKDAHAAEVRNEDLPDVVHHQSDLLRVFKLNAIVRVEGELLEHVQVRLQQPTDTGEEQEREVQVGLVLDEEGPPGRFHSLASHFLGPCEQRHGIDIRITREARAIAGVEVRHGVVSVMLVLPPLHAEALPHIADHDTDEVVCV